MRKRLDLGRISVVIIAFSLSLDLKTLGKEKHSVTLIALTRNTRTKSRQTSKQRGRDATISAVTQRLRKAVIGGR
ncbi:hypothetical protein AC249_AIPGENE3214 [Exaiptasia diaphana]|nr:hypothetical protein AC249_AIPGENE3214 [Exaiptasia diaphana]